MAHLPQGFRTPIGEHHFGNATFSCQQKGSYARTNHISLLKSFTQLQKRTKCAYVFAITHLSTFLLGLKPCDFCQGQDNPCTANEAKKNATYRTLWPVRGEAGCGGCPHCWTSDSATATRSPRFRSEPPGSCTCRLSCSQSRRPCCTHLSQTSKFQLITSYRNRDIRTTKQAWRMINAGCQKSIQNAGTRLVRLGTHNNIDMRLQYVLPVSTSTR